MKFAAGRLLLRLEYTLLFSKLHVSPARMAITSLCYILFLCIFSGNELAGMDAPAGFKGKERDALLALKKTFNHPQLNRSWNGLQCYMNYPPKWIGIQCINGRVTGVSLEGLALSGTINADALFNLTELTLLSFKNNLISGNIMNFSMNRKLTHIDLSGNEFEGPIPQSLLGLDQLQSLEFQDNGLTGEIPAFNQETLSEFNVSNNNLSGEIPKTLILQSMDASSFLGNPGLCGPPSPKACRNPISTSKKKKFSFFSGTSLVAIFVVLDVLALVLVTIIFFLYYKRVKSRKQAKAAGAEPKKKGETDAEERRDLKEEKGKFSFMDEGGDGFELLDLLKASAMDLGKGNFGSCYKAILEDGSAVVVKSLEDLNPLSQEEFKNHVRAIADIKHPNLVPLLGYYHSKDQKLLVYKFAENGNLFNRIHGGRGENRIPFKWNSRLSVAQDIARAMAYLHLSSKPHTYIPHGNLKSSNVLLTGDGEALVSDYGLPPLITAPVAIQHMMCYKSPEYHQKQKISPRSDVWSYGCLLLELLTGRVSSHSAPKGVNGLDLCNWVHRAVREGWTTEIFDIEILVQRSAASEMLKLLQIATKCCEKSPEKRPEMLEVLKEVEEINVIDLEDDDEEYYLSEISFSNEGGGYPDP